MQERVPGQLALRKIAPSPNFKGNPKPNPNPNRGAIFLKGNCPDTARNIFIKVLSKIAVPWILVTSKILYYNISNFVRKYLQKCGAGLQPGTYLTRFYIH